MSHDATRLPLFPQYLRFRALIAQHLSDGLEARGREVEPVSSELMSIIPKQPRACHEGLPESFSVELNTLIE